MEEKTKATWLAILRVVSYVITALIGLLGGTQL